MCLRTKNQIIAAAKRATADGGSAFVCCEDNEYFYLFSAEVQDWNVRECDIIAWICDGQVEEVY